MTKIDPMKRTLLKLFGLAALGGCASARGEGRSVSAVVINYTDRYIADVSVNGRWAGAANAYGGEGNRVEGFLAPNDQRSYVKLKIKWVLSDVYDVATNKYTRHPELAKETEIELQQPYPSNPSYLILHFFPELSLRERTIKDAWEDTTPLSEATKRFFDLFSHDSIAHFNFDTSRLSDWRTVYFGDSKFKPN